MNGIVHEPAAPLRPVPRVAVSGVLELTRLLLSAALGRRGHSLAGLPSPVRQAVDSIDRFWNDGVHQALELIVIADHLGRLLDDTSEALIDELDGDWPTGPTTCLASESQATRADVAARLDALASDRDVRRRYQRHVADAWSMIAPWWRTGGKAHADEHAESIAERMATLDHWTDLLPTGHAALGVEWTNLLEVGVRRQQVVVVPAVVNPRRGYFIDASVDLVVGVGLADDRTPTSARRNSSCVSQMLVPLADQTRFALLIYLADHTRTASTLAREFDLPTATVAAHLRILVAAGLVIERSDGSEVTFSSWPAAIRRVLHDVEQMMRAQVG